MVADAEVYRIDWHFNSFRTVSLQDLAAHLEEQGLDLENRDRLRALYALKLQQQFGANLFRIGPPIMPPIAWRLKGSIKRGIEGAETSTEQLDGGEIIAARFGDSLSLRLTPTVVAQLKKACHDLLSEMQTLLDGLQGKEDTATAKRSRELSHKVDALRDQIARDDLWIELLKDCSIPSERQVKKVKGSIWLARGNGWDFPKAPAVVLVIEE